MIDREVFKIGDYLQYDNGTGYIINHKVLRINRKTISVLAPGLCETIPRAAVVHKIKRQHSGKSGRYDRFFEMENNLVVYANLIIKRKGKNDA